MTLERWLKAATAGLPPEVAGRVQAEYTAHIHDSEQPEADAIATLGDPERVRRALGQTYLSAHSLGTLRNQNALTEQIFLGATLGWVILFGGLQVMYALQLHALQPGVPFAWEDVVVPVLSLLLLGLTWALTRRWPTERRKFWRVPGYLWSMQLMLWLNGALDLWRGKEGSLPWLIPLWGLAMLGWLLNMVHEDRRLRRTLALKANRP